MLSRGHLKEGCWRACCASARGFVPSSIDYRENRCSVCLCMNNAERL